MQNVVTVGKQLVPIEHIVLIEPFEANASTDVRREKPFRSRVVLLDRENALAEFTPQEFAEAHGFRLLPEDCVATNPSIMFRVETFAPTDDFKPTKPYQARLKWRARDGTDHSKLLLTAPDAVIALAVRGEMEASPDRKPLPRRPARSRTQRRRSPPTAET
jgi:hypothetical protein